jgi:nucleoside-diphosphate-sugar epimerase
MRPDKLCQTLERSGVSGMDLRMNIAVTGAAGLIGLRLVDRLVESGHDVVAIDRRIPKRRPGRFVLANLLDPHSFFAAIDGRDAVIHLGEVPYLLAGMPHEYIYQQNTAIGSNVMQASADAGVRRFVYVSTCQVYGLWGDNIRADLLPAKWPMDESQPLRPGNAYAASKAANEGYLRQLHYRHTFTSAVVRFPWVTNDLTRLVRHLPHVDGPSEGFWTMLHLDDAVDALRAAVEASHVGCEAYHFVDGQILGTMPIRDRLKRDVPDAPPLPEDWPDFAPPVSCEKARQLLGWSPTRCLRRAVEAQVGL